MTALPPHALRRLYSGHLCGSTMTKNRMGRQIGRRYASCLAGAPAPPNAKGSARDTSRVSSSSWRRNNGRSIASWTAPCALGNFSDYKNRPCNALSQNPACPNQTHPRWSQRCFSAVAYSAPTCAVENTPLDSPEGGALLRGLDVHTVHAEDDGHPLAVYTIENDDADTEQQQPRTPVLLLHGRTWSSVAVYHLAGSGGGAPGGRENRSLLQALSDANRVQPYAVDFRGFGGTPKDESGFVEPLRCVSDAVSVLNWIHEKHGPGGDGSGRPALLGWSHGALIAQITAQRHAKSLSKLVLYGSIYNPNVKYSEPYSPSDDAPHLPPKGHTDHDDFPLHEMAARNEYGRAMEDFTNVSDEARVYPCPSAKLFAEAALVSDPIKAQWWNLHQLNECHPSLVKVPTMVIAGDQDPYAPVPTQAELFTRLGRGVDRAWSIIANADHAVHLSDERRRFVENVNNFLGTRS